MESNNAVEESKNKLQCRNDHRRIIFRALQHRVSVEANGVRARRRLQVLMISRVTEWNLKPGKAARGNDSSDEHDDDHGHRYPSPETLSGFLVKVAAKNAEAAKMGKAGKPG
jgi:hypothetical protein